MKHSRLSTDEEGIQKTICNARVRLKRDAKQKTDDLRRQVTGWNILTCLVHTHTPHLSLCQTDINGSMIATYIQKTKIST